MRLFFLIIPALLAGVLSPVWAAESPAADASPLPASSAFCLVEAPPTGSTTRFINLAIVQYVELSKDRLRLVFGGGNFGGGYEADFPVKSRDEGLALLRNLQQQAQGCQRAGTARP